MATWIALLRGVNVGGVKLPMAELRRGLDEAGATDIETYIQSGNAVFSHRARSEAAVKAVVEQVAAAIVGRLVPAMVRSVRQWQEVLDANPYPTDDGTKLHVAFFDEPVPAAAVADLDPTAFAPEAFTVHGREVYLHLPGGMGRSVLATELSRTRRPQGTVRNWNTVVKLAERSAR